MCVCVCVCVCLCVCVCDERGTFSAVSKHQKSESGRSNVCGFVYSVKKGKNAELRAVWV